MNTLPWLSDTWSAEKPQAQFPRLTCACGAMADWDTEGEGDKMRWKLRCPETDRTAGQRLIHLFRDALQSQKEC